MGRARLGTEGHEGQRRGAWCAAPPPCLLGKALLIRKRSASYLWRRLLKGFACCLHSGCENAARPLFLSGQIKDTFRPSGDEIKYKRGVRWLASSSPSSPAPALTLGRCRLPLLPCCHPGTATGSHTGALPAGFGPEHRCQPPSIRAAGA